MSRASLVAFMFSHVRKTTHTHTHTTLLFFVVDVVVRWRVDLSLRVDIVNEREYPVHIDSITMD